MREDRPSGMLVPDCNRARKRACERISRPLCCPCRKAMLMSDWDPELYNRFRRYRAEPVEHILSRLQLSADERIVDLGCGSGENTLELARRSPHGTALGVDGSPAMIEAARELLEREPAGLEGRVSFELLDVPEFRAERAYTLIFSNATFQ